MNWRNRADLEYKYVLHIPLAKYVDGTLIHQNIDEILDELYDELCDNGYDVFYMSKVKGRYGSNVYDQLLITIFTSAESENVAEIFGNWFSKNNDVLCQKEFAYEYCGKLTVVKLDLKENKS
ncbi:hypothetical protein [Methanobrevibacter sp.]